MSHHPLDPRSNVAKCSGFDPDKYYIGEVSLSVKNAEDLIPGRAATLTQQSIGKYLKTNCPIMDEVPPRPSIDELPDTVIEKMVQKDKAFWVDKPGTNAYTLHDAYDSYRLSSDIVKPPRQDVFPRSYQYDIDCVQYRHLHACDALRGIKTKKPLASHCRRCTKSEAPMEQTSPDSDQKRWRVYPDLIATLTQEEIRNMMDEVGRPFQNEACNWYYKNYPSEKYNFILRKFAK